MGPSRESSRDAGLARGKAFLESLHAVMPRFVRQQTTTFHDLFTWTNEHIASGGFENLDFRGNVGHSIGEHRCFIEAGNHD